MFETGWMGIRMIGVETMSNRRAYINSPCEVVRILLVLSELTHFFQGES